MGLIAFLAIQQQEKKNDPAGKDQMSRVQQAHAYPIRCEAQKVLLDRMSKQVAPAPQAQSPGTLRQGRK